MKMSEIIKKQERYSRFLELCKDLNSEELLELLVLLSTEFNKELTT